MLVAGPPLDETEQQGNHALVQHLLWLGAADGTDADSASARVDIVCQHLYNKAQQPCESLTELSQGLELIGHVFQLTSISAACLIPIYEVATQYLTSLLPSFSSCAAIENGLQSCTIDFIQTIISAVRSGLFTCLTDISWFLENGAELFERCFAVGTSLISTITTCMSAAVEPSHGSGDLVMGSVMSCVQQWSAALLACAAQAVEVSAQTGSPAPPAMRTFLLINTIWKDLLRLLTGLPVSMRQASAQIYTSGFISAWRLFEVCTCVLAAHDS
jgi:hypothetical protein